MEDDDPLEWKEKIEEARDRGGDEAAGAGGWKRFMALTTALIAVCAALSSLLSGSYANEAILQKNDAILLVSQETDDWNYYQARGLRKGLDDAFYRQTKDTALLAESQRFSRLQDSIRSAALKLDRMTIEANERSEALMQHHHLLAISVTIFQIAIALTAMSALLARKSFWYLSLGLSGAGLALLIAGLV